MAAILAVGLFRKEDYERGLRPASPLPLILFGLVLLAMGTFFLAVFWMGGENTLTRQEFLWLLTLGPGCAGTGLLMLGLGVRRLVLARRGLGIPATPPWGASFRIIQFSLPVLLVLSMLVRSGHEEWWVTTVAVALALFLAFGLVWRLIREG